MRCCKSNLLNRLQIVEFSEPLLEWQHSDQSSSIEDSLHVLVTLVAYCDSNAAPIFYLHTELFKGLRYLQITCRVVTVLCYW